MSNKKGKLNTGEGLEFDGTTTEFLKNLPLGGQNVDEIGQGAGPFVYRVPTTNNQFAVKAVFDDPSGFIVVGNGPKVETINNVKMCKGLMSAWNKLNRGHAWGYLEPGLHLACTMAEFGEMVFSGRFGVAGSTCKNPKFAKVIPAEGYVTLSKGFAGLQGRALVWQEVDPTADELEDVKVGRARDTLALHMGVDMLLNSGKAYKLVPLYYGKDNSPLNGAPLKEAQARFRDFWAAVPGLSDEEDARAYYEAIRAKRIGRQIAGAHIEVRREVEGKAEPRDYFNTVLPLNDGGEGKFEDLRGKTVVPRYMAKGFVAGKYTIDEENWKVLCNWFKGVPGNPNIPGDPNLNLLVVAQ